MNKLTNLIGGIVSGGLMLHAIIASGPNIQVSIYSVLFTYFMILIIKFSPNDAFERMQNKDTAELVTVIRRAGIPFIACMTSFWFLLRSLEPLILRQLSGYMDYIPKHNFFYTILGLIAFGITLFVLITEGYKALREFHSTTASQSGKENKQMYERAAQILMGALLVIAGFSLSFELSPGASSDWSLWLFAGVNLLFVFRKKLR